MIQCVERGGNVIDLKKANEEFDKYVKNYNSEDKKIALKIEHIKRVSEISGIISENLNLDKSVFYIWRKVYMKKNLTYSILTIIAVLIFTVLQNFLKISFRNSGIIAIIIIISGTVFIEAKFAGEEK